MATDGARLKISYRNAFKDSVGKNSIKKTVVIVITHLALAALSAYASFRFLAAINILSVSIYIAALFFIGSRYRALANMMHETVHYSLTTNRQWNIIFGRLLSIPLFSAFSAYRSAHLSHHTHTGHFEKDLDFRDFKQFHFEEPITQKVILRHLGITSTLRHVPSYIGKALYVSEDPLLYRILRLAYVGTILAVPVVSGLSSSASLAIVLYVIAPYVTTLQIITYWSDALDHGGLFHNEDELYQTRNSIVRGRIWRMICFPRNDCFHLVHHMFPQIPVASLPASHELLMRDANYAALDHELVSRSKKMINGRERSSQIAARRV